MNMRRDIYDKYKVKMWFVKIGTDKYIWIKKPRYIIRNIFRVIWDIIKFPFAIILFLIMCLAELVVGGLILDLLKELGGEFVNILPRYIQVTDKNELISESKLKIKDGKFIDNINSDKI